MIRGIGRRFLFWRACRPICQIGAATLSNHECLRAGRSSVEKHFFRGKSDSDLLQNVGAEVKMQTE